MRLVGRDISIRDIRQSKSESVRRYQIAWDSRPMREAWQVWKRYGRLSLEKGLVAPAKEATKQICSQLQWREALKRLAIYRARSRVSVRSSCGSVGPYPVKLQGAADRASTYRHFSYAWRHRLAVAVYVSILQWRSNICGRNIRGWLLICENREN